jgi:endonuclease/exonuclease/phosphatase family metal-dependent hydrolase
MRLLTLNIRFGAGIQRLDKPGYDVPATGEKIAAIASAVQSVDPDVVALQEVKSAKQAQRIASMLGMSNLYCRHPSSYAMDFFEWGLAFAYRLDKTGHGNVSLYFDESTRAGRQMLIASFSDRGTPFSIINVHLDRHNIELQVANILAAAEKMQDPVMLSGDFNCTPDDPALARLKGKWIDACRAVFTPGASEAESIGTVLNNASRIDCIFVDPDRFTVRDAGLLPEPHRRVSDHIGFYADIDPKEFRKKGNGSENFL